jgi:hypothetical protein
MDEDSVRDTRDVRRRDNTGATGEDTFNREAMPKVMQVYISHSTASIKCSVLSRGLACGKAGRLAKQKQSRADLLRNRLFGRNNIVP